MEPLRAGLVGLGAMGANHARTLASLDGVTLVGIADPVRAGSQISGVRVCADPSALLREGIDYAVIATPTISHVEVALELVQQGVHILVEKPLAHSAMAAARLAAAANAAGVVGAVGHIERYNSSVREARRRIELGQLGKLLQITTRRQGPFPERISDVGVAMDLATHDIDLASWVAQSDYESLSAVATRGTGRIHEDSLLASATLVSGVICNHVVNWLSPFKERCVTVLGDAGAFVIDTLTADLTFYANGHGTNEWPEMANFRGVQVGDVTRYAISRREPLRVQHEQFRDALLGSGGEIVELDAGVRVVTVAEAMLTSAQLGTAVRI